MTTTLYDARTTAPEAARPLIFAFHGSGGDENQFFALAQALVPGAGVVAPRGKVNEPQGARFFDSSQQDDAAIDSLHHQTEQMLTFAKAHTANAPGHPAYAFGYSNGASLLASLTMRCANLFDRVALLHPSVDIELPHELALQVRSVLICGGEKDLDAPASKLRRLAQWFRAQGSQVETHMHDGGHELRQSEVEALQGFLQQR